MIWTNIKKTGRYPKHNQHVLVWTDRSNVFMWGRKTQSELSDDGTGRVRMGDAVFIDKKIDWCEQSDAYRSRWDGFDDFISINGPRYEWRGQGPCSFSEVTHWMDGPGIPEDATIFNEETR